jgi:hypothetical protein
MFADRNIRNKPDIERLIMQINAKYLTNETAE